MAVTKIRRISSWSLIACTVISVVIFIMFFFGGDYEPYKGEMWNPIYTGLLIEWQYALLFIAAAAAVFFAIMQFINNFKHNPKGGIMGLVVMVLFIGLLYVTYAIGDSTPLPLVNPDIQSYNTPFYLKFTDMWMYSTYVMMALVILAVLAGSVKNILNK